MADFEKDYRDLERDLSFVPVDNPNPKRLTPEQIAWIKMQQMMLKVKPTHAHKAKGKGRLRKLCWLEHGP